VITEGAFLPVSVSPWRKYPSVLVFHLRSAAAAATRIIKGHSTSANKSRALCATCVRVDACSA